MRKILYVAAWVVWLVFCYFLSQTLIFTTIDLSPIEIHSDDTTTLTIISATVYVATLALLVGIPWLARKTLKIPPKIFELIGLSRKIKWPDVSRGAVTFLLYLAVLIGAMSIFAFVFPDLSNQEQQLGFAKTGNSLWQLVLIFVSLVIIPPVFEEMIMRGFLFGRLRSKLSYLPTAIIVSAIFAVSHGQINVAVDTFILSLFLCHVREKTGTIWGTMLIHVLKNLLGFLMVFVFAV